MQARANLLRMWRDHVFARRVSDYVDGELDPARGRRLAAHARACPNSEPLLRSLTLLVAELRRLEHHEPELSPVPTVQVRLHPRRDRPVAR